MFTYAKNFNQRQENKQLKKNYKIFGNEKKIKSYVVYIYFFICNQKEVIATIMGSWI